MKLPNADMAIIDPCKIRDYCLNPEHPRGKHKATIFKAVLGLTKSDAYVLISEITREVQYTDCKVGEKDKYGQRYLVDIVLKINKKQAVVRTGWIVKQDESLPRLTTCYVL